MTYKGDDILDPFPQAGDSQAGGLEQGVLVLQHVPCRREALRNGGRGRGRRGGCGSRRRRLGGEILFVLRDQVVGRDQHGVEGLLEIRTVLGDVVQADEIEGPDVGSTMPFDPSHGFQRPLQPLYQHESTEKREAPCIEYGDVSLGLGRRGKGGGGPLAISIERKTSARFQAWTSICRNSSSMTITHRSNGLVRTCRHSLRPSSFSKRWMSLSGAPKQINVTDGLGGGAAFSSGVSPCVGLADAAGEGAGLQCR
jgi:hypothetical protein